MEEVGGRGEIGMGCECLRDEIAFAVVRMESRFANSGGAGGTM
jgi:hypothetical protein